MSGGVPDSERLAWLRLARSEGVGATTFASLIRRFGTATRALAALPDLVRGRRTPMAVGSLADAEKELAAAKAAGATLVTAGDPAFPSLLGVLEPPPPLIYVKGRLDLLARDCVAIVGARNASAGGRKLAEDLAAGLGFEHITVVSGLARGIDTAAHVGALATGTVAVVAGGIDVVYPPENAKLQARIGEEGVLVSEMPPGLAPMASHFPRRNRIISGLALGTIVVEAAIGSGSLITARQALEQNREVFAVPGSPLDPRSRGANDLIRQGAVLTESADDVLQVLKTVHRPGFEQPPADEFQADPDGDLAPARRAILELLSPTPVSLDELIRRSGIAPSTVLTVLLELDLTERLERSPGQKVALR